MIKECIPQRVHFLVLLVQQSEGGSQGFTQESVAGIAGETNIEKLTKLMKAYIGNTKRKKADELYSSQEGTVIKFFR
jgi:hypothetical protein